MAKPSQGKLLYHITHSDNIQSILINGLMSRKSLSERGICGFTDIADPEIISKRSRYKEVLSNYVLFHFYAKNPFDGAVCKKYGSENMVIISVRRDYHIGNEFYIIPSHPLDSDTPDIYPYEEGFKKIRWDILDNTSARDYHDPEIRKACMAECIVQRIIPTGSFTYIYTYNEAMKRRIVEMDNSDPKIVLAAPNMFP